MENAEIDTLQNETFSVNKEIRIYLAETAKWGNILAIIGYVFMGILILMSLIMIFFFSFFSRQTGYPMWLFGIIYLLLAGAYWFPVTYLYRFSAQMQQAVKNGDEKLYTSGFANLKSLFKFFGIFTIVMLVLYGLMAIVAVVIQVSLLK